MARPERRLRAGRAAARAAGLIAVVTAPLKSHALPRFRALRLGAVRATVALLALLAASALLRSRALAGTFWMDEGLSVGIASHRLLDIPGLLRQDGSPPLYYLLLGAWMDAVGDSEARTHALSALCALLAVPAGLWAGRSLFGPRAGWICAVLAAVNPFLTAYGQETRMYALLGLESVLATALFVHVFVFRRRQLLPAFAGVLALMLYTHNWGLFFAAGAVAALLVLLRWAPERRALLRDGVLGFGGAGLLYVPWLPTLAYQAAHTGAPWSNKPRFGVPVQIAKGMLGGGGPAIALLLAGGAGVLTLRGREATPERRAAVALAATGVGTLAIAWLFSQLSPAWNVRYFGAVLGPLLLLASLGLARARALGIAALVCASVLSLRPMVYNLKNKSNARDVAAQVGGALRPGDVVISTQPEQLPMVHYYLPGPYRYATTLGPVSDARIMDWRDGVERLRASRPARALTPLLERVALGGHVLLVRPITFGTTNWRPEWTALARRRSAQWGEAMSRDSRFRLTTVAPTFYRHASVVGVAGLLYTRVRA